MISITLGRARRNMEAANISAAMLARLAEVKPSTLSAAFRSIVHLGSEKEVELLRVSAHVLELQEALRPFREPTNVDDLRRVLDFIQANSISTEQIREAITSVFGVAETNSGNQ